MSTRPFAVALIALALAAPARSQEQEAEPTPEQIEAAMAEFESSLGWRTGTADVKSGLASVSLGESWRWLEPADAQRLLVDGWGNPPESASDVLGVIAPVGLSPLSENGWAIVVSYDEDGYVKDDDAAKIDYDDLMKEMKDGSQAVNEEREKAGYERVNLIGWAEAPSYDASTHKMYWAKELQFGDSPEHTLNYSVRVLGRGGVLNLNAVCGMSQLSNVRGWMQDVLARVEFTDGNRYADFKEGSDKVAEYGIAGLVLGAVATKAGLFKGLLAVLLAGKKLVVVAAVGAIALLKKLFSGKGAAPAA